MAWKKLRTPRRPPVNHKKQGFRSDTKYYKVTVDDILVSKRGHFNEPRNVAIYLIRSIRNDTLKGVGKAFGIDKNSTVGSVVERVKREMEKNKDISKRVKNLKDILGKS